MLQDEASDVSDIEDSEDEAPRELLAPQPFDEDAMFEAAAAALDAAEAAERERAAAAALFAGDFETACESLFAAYDGPIPPDFLAALVGDAA